MSRKAKWWLAVGIVVVFALLVGKAIDNHSKYAQKQMHERGKSYAPDFMWR